MDAYPSCIQLDDQQQHGLDVILNSTKSVFITGEAGTGKTVLLNAIIRAYSHLGSGLAVTASTGTAAIDLPYGQTLHRFAGAGIGDIPPEKMAKILKSGKSMGTEKARLRWENTSLLIIDEISMISSQFFEYLHELACRMRNKSFVTPFGGIRLICCGDFYQHPPVNNSKYTPPFAFLSPLWKNMHIVNIVLCEKHRQESNSPYAQMLNEIRCGKISARTVNLLKSRIGVKFGDHDLVTNIFPKKKDVQWENNRRLRLLPGDVHLFRADDYLADNVENVFSDKIRAPTLIELKIGAQVMLIKNLPIDDTEFLHNGLVGKIESIDHESSTVNVQFINQTQLLSIQPVKWSFYDNENGGKLLFSRTQIPLVLAYAMTGHKSQGQTILNPVITDLESCFEYGQAYVILSRIRDISQLSLRSFDIKKIKAHPVVSTFYANMK